MTENTEHFGAERVLETDLQIGVDALGDPFVRCNVQMGPETAFTAEMADQFALQLLAAAAAARTRATIVQRRMLAGEHPSAAVAFVNRLLGE